MILSFQWEQDFPHSLSFSLYQLLLRDGNFIYTEVAPCVLLLFLKLDFVRHMLSIHKEAFLFSSECTGAEGRISF